MNLVVMRAAAKVPMADRGTRYLRVLTSLSFGPLPAGHCRYSANSPKSTIKLENNCDLLFLLLYPWLPDSSVR
jgi:hypothetical protein